MAKKADQQATTAEAVDTETGEILEVEILAPDVVSQALTKYNVTDAALADLKAAWQGFAIQGVEDKAGYTKAVEGYRTLKKLRTGTEAKRKALKAPFYEAGQKIDAEAKRITAVIAPLEDHLKHQVDLIDQQLEAIRREEERRRIAMLTAAGFQLSGQFYVCGPVMILLSDVMAYDEAKLQEEINRGAEWTKAEAERKAKEQAELEELRRLKAENEARQRELDEREARLKAKEQQQAQPGDGYQPTVDETIPEPPQDSGTTDGPAEPQTTAQAAAPSPAPQAAAPAPQPQASTSGPHPAFKAGWNQGIERIISIFTDPNAQPMKRQEWADKFREQMLG